jgi:DNA-binding NarL/FixJ family response regulator
VPVEFSATANVLPARHLSVFIPPEEGSAEQAKSVLTREATWAPVVVEGTGRVHLTEREREVMTLVASGLQSGDLAGQLFLSPETVKSHVHNALAKLGAHTRACCGDRIGHRTDHLGAIAVMPLVVTLSPSGDIRSTSYVRGLRC